MTISGYCRRALWSGDLNLPQPELQLAAEESILGIVCRAQLLVKALGPEERYPGLMAVDGPPSPDEPDVEVQRSRSVSKTSDSFPLHGDAVLVDLVMQCFAERDGVIVGCRGCVMHFGIRIELESHVIEEVKTSGVKKQGAVRSFLGSKENCGGKYSFKSRAQPAIVWTVFGKPKEFKQLSRGIEVYCSGLLLDGERCHADRDEVVVAVGQAEVGVWDNLKEEISAVSGGGPAVRSAVGRFTRSR